MDVFEFQFMRRILKLIVACVFFFFLLIMEISLVGLGDWMNLMSKDDFF